MRILRFLAFIVLAAVLLITSCTARSAREGSLASDQSGKRLIAVSILPQAEFARRIAGDLFRVMTLVGPGQSPHSFDPSPRQLEELKSASAWFTVGIEFEHALQSRIATLFPALRIIDTTGSVPKRQLDKESTPHGETGPDPHTWLGWIEAKQQIAVMRDTLIGLDPDGAASYRRNYDAYIAEIDAVFRELSVDLAPLSGKPVFVFHPAFGYFLDEFGIVQVAVETGGKEPTQKNLADLIRQARAAGAKVIFVQAQFPVAAARNLAQSLGGAVEPLDDLAPDWLENLKRMGAALKKGLQ